MAEYNLKKITVLAVLDYAQRTNNDCQESEGLM